MLIASANPLLVFYRSGHTAGCLEDYDANDFKNRWRHITNPHVQETHPEYWERQNELNLDFASLQAVLDESKSAPPNWVETGLVVTSLTLLRFHMSAYAFRLSFLKISVLLP